MNRECRLQIKDKVIVREAIIKVLDTLPLDMNNTSLASSKDMIMVPEATSRDVAMVTKHTSKDMLTVLVLTVSSTLSQHIPSTSRLLFRKR
jgi:hypothetical protein